MRRLMKYLELATASNRLDKKTILLTVGQQHRVDTMSPMRDGWSEMSERESKCRENE